MKWFTVRNNQEDINLSSTSFYKVCKVQSRCLFCNAGITGTMHSIYIMLSTDQFHLSQKVMINYVGTLDIG